MLYRASFSQIKRSLNTEIVWLELNKKWRMLIMKCIEKKKDCINQFFKAYFFNKGYYVSPTVPSGNFPFCSLIHMIFKRNSDIFWTKDFSTLKKYIISTLKNILI